MQFLAALVEHFVVGVVSLLWVIPLLHEKNLLPSLSTDIGKDSGFVAIGIPAIYVIGMFVDVFASFFTKLLRRIYKTIYKTDFIKLVLTRRPFKWPSEISKWLSEGKNPYENTAKILNESPDEKAKHFLQLAGREKIARGAFFSLVVATGLNLSWFDKSIYTIPWGFLAWCTLAGLIVWLRHAFLIGKLKEQMRGQESVESASAQQNTPS